MNADRSVFATGASENFCDRRGRRKSDRRLKIFGLARANYMCPPTDFFCARRDRSKSARQTKFFLDWRERSTCDRRPIFIVPGATESFCDWRGRSLTARQPHVFATQKTEAQMAADRNKSVNWPIFFSLLARAKLKWPPPEVFLCLARPKVFATGASRSTSVRQPIICCDWFKGSTCDRWRNHFRDWRERSKNDRRRKFLRLARPKIFVSGATKAKHSAEHIFSATEVTEGRAIADQSVFAPGAAESFLTGVTEA